MRPTRWWQTGVVYQVYPRSFGDSNGDGVGDLEGIRQHLDYLAWLGVDAIWISPFYRSPMKDFGYDVADYTDVDPLFGDLAAFDRLLADAHARGLRVIVDFVPNHTSDQHAWFIESRSSRSSPKRDWYVWRDPKPDGGPPNNWISVFGGSAWALDAPTGQYYLHSFLAEQPDLDWRNPDVKRAMFDVLRFWLDRGVDGFRIDVAQFIAKDPLYRDNPPHPEPERMAYMGAWSRQLHLYDFGHPDLHAIYREFRALLDSYPGDRVSIGELHDEQFDVWAGFYGHNLDEIHVPFNFHLLFAKWEAARIRTIVDASRRRCPTARGRTGCSATTTSGGSRRASGRRRRASRCSCCSRCGAHPRCTTGTSWDCRTPSSDRTRFAIRGASSSRRRDAIRVAPRCRGMERRTAGSAHRMSNRGCPSPRGMTSATWPRSARIQRRCCP